jgi:hypothetical protein
MNVVAASLDYARRGWRVFPAHGIVNGRCTCGRSCSAPGKHPATTNGVKDASVDQSRIEAYWSKKAEMNVGIATGSVSGFWVLDVDAKSGGLDTLRDLERQHGELPRTVVSHTGGGGRHFLFVLEDGDRVQSRVGVFQGVDVRGEGGYIVGPPSRHASGQSYVWDVDHHPDDVGLARAPEWLMAAVRGRNEEKPPAKSSSEWMAVLEASRRQGGRDDGLTRIAGHLYGRGVDGVVAWALLRAWNDARVSPPLDGSDVDRIAASIAAAERRREGRHDD